MEHLYSLSVIYVQSIAVSIAQWLRLVILPVFLTIFCIKLPENFVQGPWFVLFYLTWVLSLKCQDYQTFSQLFFVLCEMFLFLEFSSDFNVVTLS